eukprot:1787694-Rhodomonas_salina.1
MSGLHLAGVVASTTRKAPNKIPPVSETLVERKSGSIAIIVWTSTPFVINAYPVPYVDAQIPTCVASATRPYCRTNARSIPSLFDFFFPSASTRRCNIFALIRGVTSGLQRTLSRSGDLGGTSWLFARTGPSLTGEWLERGGGVLLESRLSNQLVAGFGDNRFCRALLWWEVRTGRAFFVCRTTLVRASSEARSFCPAASRSALPRHSILGDGVTLPSMPKISFRASARCKVGPRPMLARRRFD